jgi:hypothetical protein
MYWLEHHKGRHATVLGDTANPDHVTVTVLIQNIDPSTARISAQLELRGAGSLVDEHTHDLKEDATLISNAVTNPTVISKANERPEFDLQDRGGRADRGDLGRRIQGLSGLSSSPERDRLRP